LYATLDDVRGEGVQPVDADDARVLAAVEEATRLVDQLCGWHFEPREMELRLDGRGTRTLWLAVAPILVDRVEVNGAPLSRAPEDLVIVGAPAQPGFDGPRLTRTHGVFPRGAGNVIVQGLFGFTEPDGTLVGRVPRAIRRAAMLLALRSLAPLSAVDGDDVRARWRVIEERTRDQSVKFAEPDKARLTGDAEIDRLLAPYGRASAMGAA
jgi:hypothetical protein